MVYVETIHFIRREEASHFGHRALPVNWCRTVLDGHIHLIVHIPVQLLRISFLKCHDHPNRNILRSKERCPDQETSQ